MSCSQEEIIMKKFLLVLVAAASVFLTGCAGVGVAAQGDGHGNVRWGVVGAASNASYPQQQRQAVVQQVGGDSRATECMRRTGSPAFQMVGPTQVQCLGGQQGGYSQGYQPQPQPQPQCPQGMVVGRNQFGQMACGYPQGSAGYQQGYQQNQQSQAGWQQDWQQRQLPPPVQQPQIYGSGTGNVVVGSGRPPYCTNGAPVIMSSPPRCQY